ncbi:MAG: hypothetical protein JXK07_07000 [Spirochaetes bacterium]|nr:hypothetical protein [Spirochaetota bacterium]MBN2770620.1 hypothetical protein [Spirochaetota bacterium]
MKETDNEYNAFGPWIYEIDDEHPLPRALKKYTDKAGNYEMLIKIPVNIERRKLKPGMDMYNRVLGVHTDYFQIISKQGDKVSSEKIPYERIEAVEYKFNLLEGRFRLYTDNSLFEIIFNASSMEIIGKLSKLVRDNITKDHAPIDIGQYSTISTDTSLFFKNIYNELIKENGDFKIIGYHDDIDIRYAAYKLHRFLFKILLKPKIAGTLHVTNGKELAVVTHGSNTVKTAKDPAIAGSFLFIPFANIRHIYKTVSDKYNGIIKYKIMLKNHGFDFYRNEAVQLSYLDKLEAQLRHISSVK